MTFASRVLHSVWAGASRAAAWPFRVAAARATLRSLAQMDRRELADIGLNPSDVSDVAALPLDRDPSALLAARARERPSARVDSATHRVGADVEDDNPHGKPRRNRPSPEAGSGSARPRRQNRLSWAPAPLACGGRLEEEVGAQRPRRLAVAEAARGHLEPAPDHPGVGARARHAPAPLRLVVLALAHRLHERDGALEPVGIVDLQPFAEHVAQFARQPQDDIAALARAGGIGAGQDRLEFLVVDRRE